MQGPVIAIALILAAVFIPVAFMSGITGRLYQQFALTIAISVLISAFNALTLSPALSALLLRPRSEHDGASSAGSATASTAGFGRATDGYVAVNRRLVRKLAIPLLLLAGVAGVVGARSARKLPTGFVPDEDQGYAIIGVQLPDGASLQRTQGRLREDQRDPRASSRASSTYNGVAGFSFFTRTAASYTGTGFVGLKPWDERKTPELTSTAHPEEPQRARSRSIPEARVFAVAPPAIPGISAAGRLQHDAAGPERRDLRSSSRRTSASSSPRRASGPSSTSVRPIFSPGVPQLFADVDKDKALKQGVAIAEIYNALQTFLGGSYVNDFTRFGRQWRVFLQAEPRVPHRAPTTSAQFYVRNARARWCRSRRSCTCAHDQRARVHGALQPVSLGRDPGHPTRRATAPARRSTRSRTSPRRRCRPRWATRGTRSRIRRRSRRAARRACSGSRSCSSS